jgi:hypothetical protein
VKAIRCVGEIPKRSLDIILPNEAVLMWAAFLLSPDDYHIGRFQNGTK